MSIPMNRHGSAARLILRSTSFEVRHGGVAASAFLIDMHQVFERFVYVALREALGLSERASAQRGAPERYQGPGRLWLHVHGSSRQTIVRVRGGIRSGPVVQENALAQAGVNRL